MRKKIAILGASGGQKPLYEKAKRLGLYIVGISQAEGAISKDLADVFYPVNLADRDAVLRVCQEEAVEGVVSNASEFSAKVVAYVADKLHLAGNPYDTFVKLQDKDYVRSVSNGIEGFSSVRHIQYEGQMPSFFPCIIKPNPGAGKSGLSIANDANSFDSAIQYAQSLRPNKILIEEYVVGREVSVETISSHGKHYVVQITDKETSGAPHFVELAHHQPSTLPQAWKDKICKAVPLLLDGVGFVAGASHVELKVSDNGDLYLIELNPRGGGDEISNRLVELSTNYDYVEGMVLAAMGEELAPQVNHKAYSGIYFLTKQTEDYLPFFLSASVQPWYVDGHIASTELTECMGNSYRDGYLIYQSEESKISPSSQKEKE